MTPQKTFAYILMSEKYISVNFTSVGGFSFFENTDYGISINCFNELNSF